MVITGAGTKSGSIPPTFEQLQNGSAMAGATAAVFTNYIWATLINK
jgi:hypothetical protein